MDKLSTLWQGASYQDHLLQSYRGFHLTTQSIFLAVGTGLSIAIIAENNIVNQIFTYFLLLLITLLSFYMLRKMRSLIIARGIDVDYYHRLIIKYEESLEKENQVLTDFKVYQKIKREYNSFDDYIAHYTTRKIPINELIDKGKGHTRRFLDTGLFIWFYITWIGFHLIAISSVLNTVILEF